MMSIGLWLVLIVIIVGLCEIPTMSVGPGTATTIVGDPSGGSDGTNALWMVKLADRPGVTRVHYGGSVLADGDRVVISRRLGGGLNLDRDQYGGRYPDGSSRLFTPADQVSRPTRVELPAERVPDDPTNKPIEKGLPWRP